MTYQTTRELIISTSTGIHAKIDAIFGYRTRGQGAALDCEIISLEILDKANTKQVEVPIILNNLSSDFLEQIEQEITEEITP